MQHKIRTVIPVVIVKDKIIIDNSKLICLNSFLKDGAPCCWN